MNEDYDVIVCGTGLKECILSGLLSVKGKKVLHLDRNAYYGGDCASLNITNLWKMFRPGVEPEKKYGPNREWNVDLIPKFVVAKGKLVQILLYTKVTKYLEWKCVDGTFVYQVSKGGMFSSAKAAIHKVPANDSEALGSKLMGLWEKKRCRNFFIYVQEYDPTNPKTFKDFDPTKQTFAELISKFSLESNTVDFLGHAVSLYIEDSFLSLPAINTINRIKLYMDSIGIYGNSPFLYPIYGLGGIPEGFSRLCAIHGGTYMLNKGVDEFLFDADGKINGVKSGDEVAKAKVVITDPSYLLNTPHVKKVGRVIRCINIMDHPIPNTKDVASCQIIIPQKQVNRKYDIFISMVSASHLVCPKGLYIAMISTTVETENPELEIQPALELIGQPLEQFITISDLYEPTGTGTDNNLYVTKSYDATSHFEDAANEVLSIYEKITGEKLDLTVVPEKDEEDQ